MHRAFYKKKGGKKIMGIERIGQNGEQDKWTLLQVTHLVMEDCVMLVAANAGLGTPQPVIMQARIDDKFFREKWNNRDSKIIPIGQG